MHNLDHHVKANFASRLRTLRKRYLNLTCGTTTNKVSSHPYFFEHVYEILGTLIEISFSMRTNFQTQLLMCINFITFVHELLHISMYFFFYLDNTSYCIYSHVETYKITVYIFGFMVLNLNGH